MAQAYGACWVVQKDAMDGSLQAKSAMSATEPPRTPGIDQTIIRTTSCFSKQRCPFALAAFLHVRFARLIELT